MLHFVFFWRLTQEKGIDLILDSFLRLHNEWVNNWKLSIFGDGPYNAACTQADKRCPNITFYGRTKQAEIHSHLPEMDYAIMPSRIIETFWKSALESIYYGVPVIWFKQWWLEQFIEDIHAIHDKNLYNTVLYLIKNNVIPNKEEYHQKALLYNKDAWMQKVISCIGTVPRITYVSDFIDQIWWIETFLRESKTLLEDNWYKVSLFGAHGKPNILQMCFAWIGNILIAYQLFQHRRKNIPGTIRYHSLIRRIWWLWVQPRSLHYAQFITIHDMGYFHPYPSRLYYVKYVPAFSLKQRMAVWQSRKQKIMISFKFISMRLLRERLTKKIDTWFVPSEFMVEILHTRRKIPKEKIVVLPHFI